MVRWRLSDAIVGKPRSYGFAQGLLAIDRSRGLQQFQAVPPFGADSN